MFKKVFLLGLIAGLFGTAISYVYVNAYKSIITDYSEVANFTRLIAHNMLFTMIGCFLFFGLSSIIKNKGVATFIFNFLVSGVCIALVFFQLKQPNPKFSNDDINLMADFYNGFFLPIIFIPALSWFTFKPLFIK